MSLILNALLAAALRGLIPTMAYRAGWPMRSPERWKVNSFGMAMIVVFSDVFFGAPEWAGEGALGMAVHIAASSAGWAIGYYALARHMEGDQ